MKRLVLFDIDGTLINGGKLFRECLEGAMRDSLPGRPELPRVAFSGKTDRQICREMLEALGVYGADTPDDHADREAHCLAVIDEYLARVRRELPFRQDAIQALPGVEAALSELRAIPGVHLGLLTGNVRAGARVKLGAVGLDVHFEALGEVGAFGDDHWDRYRLPTLAVDRARSRFGVEFKGKEVVIIGDTAHDVLCGQSIGVRAIGVGTGRPEEREKVLGAKPDYFLEDLSELERVLWAVLEEK
jgi:phosphoglycolate phosphatase-like HAD superfamily hydrolase